MKLSKCCEAEIKTVMTDDSTGSGIHETTSCSDCGELAPEEATPEAEVYIRISDRKAPGYPTWGYVILFRGDLTVFETKVDGIIDDLDIRKADVYIDNPEEFNEDEQETLVEMGFIL
jgi:hypothetical protein